MYFICSQIVSTGFSLPRAYTSSAIVSKKSYFSGTSCLSFVHKHYLSLSKFLYYDRRAPAAQLRKSRNISSLNHIVACSQREKNSFVNTRKSPDQLREEMTDCMQNLNHTDVCMTVPCFFIPCHSVNHKDIYYLHYVERLLPMTK